MTLSVNDINSIALGIPQYHSVDIPEIPFPDIIQTQQFPHIILGQSHFNRILSKVQKSFWCCTHVNSFQYNIQYPRIKKKSKD